jgi:cytochrome c-type biogenesis protein CcmH/NrfG
VSRDSLIVGVCGVFFGVLIGWIIGSQQGTGRVAPQQAAPAASTAPTSGSQAPAALDESRAAALKSTATQHPEDSATRIQLANMYFDAERFQEAARWYEEALKIAPKDVNASTDLGIAYYYMNQPDKALAQFEHSLSLDPKHAKTLLNVGIVRAFGKQDLNGASAAWEEVLKVAPPNSDEAQAARQALEGVRAAHQGAGGSPSGATGK